MCRAFLFLHVADLGIDTFRNQALRQAGYWPSRMEIILNWASWLEPVDAKIVWLRASGTRWKEICWDVGLARVAAHEHCLYALCAARTCFPYTATAR